MYIAINDKIGNHKDCLKCLIDHYQGKANEQSRLRFNSIKRESNLSLGNDDLIKQYGVVKNR